MGEYATYTDIENIEKNLLKIQINLQNNINSAVGLDNKSTETMYKRTSQGLSVENSASNGTYPGMDEYLENTQENLEVFKSAYLGGECDLKTYCGAMDGDHYYTLFFPTGDGTDPWGTGVLVGENSVLIKLNKFNGEVVGSIKSSEMFSNSTEAGKGIGLRGPVTVHKGHIYITNKSDLAIAKINCETMKLVWNFRKDEIIDGADAPGTNFIPDAKNGIATSLVTEDANGNTMIYGGSVLLNAYVGLGFADDQANWSRNYGWYGSSGVVMAFKDNGTSCESVFDFYIGPRMIQPGETIPEECFQIKDTANTNTKEVKIYYPLVYQINPETNEVVENSLNFTGSTPSYTFDASTAGTVPFLPYDLVDGAPVRRIDVFSDYTFASGQTITSGETLTASDGTKLAVDALFITGQPIHKVLKRGNVCNKYDAQNLNYYGGGFWSPMVHDKVTKTVLFGVGNGHKAPLQDALILQDIPNQDLLINLGNDLNDSIQSFKDGKITEAEYELKLAAYTSSLENQETNKIHYMSARANRFIVSCLGCIGEDGLYKWHRGAAAYDAFSWGQKNLGAATYGSVLGSNSDNSISAVIFENENMTDTVNGRKLVTGDKTGALYYVDPDSNYSSDANGRDGVSNRVLPTTKLVVAGLAGGYGGAVWGAAKSNDNKLFVCNQVNQPWKRINGYENQYYGEKTLKEVRKYIDDNAWGCVLKNVNLNKHTEELCKKVTDNYTFIPSGVNYNCAFNVVTNQVEWNSPRDIGSIDARNGANGNLLGGSWFWANNLMPKVCGEIVVQGSIEGNLWFCNVSDGKGVHRLVFPSGTESNVCASGNVMLLDSSSRAGNGRIKGRYLHMITPHGQ
tara:strand:+ start:2501 stop:5053 length:2553 start_codon:yes stop_codon:yes gene_type:complete